MTALEAGNQAIGRAVGITMSVSDSRILFTSVNGQGASRFENEAAVYFSTEVMSDKVIGYHISYGSSWSDSVRAAHTATLLNIASEVAAALEAIGVPFKS